MGAGATRWLTPPGTVSMRTAGDSCALRAPLPGAQSAGEEELPGAGSGLGEDGFEVVACGVLGHYHLLGDLAGVEALAEQREDFGFASGQSAGPGVDVQAVRGGARLDRHRDVGAQP